MFKVYMFIQFCLFFLQKFWLHYIKKDKRRIQCSFQDIILFIFYLWDLDVFEINFFVFEFLYKTEYAFQVFYLMS